MQVCFTILNGHGGLSGGRLRHARIARRGNTGNEDAAKSR